MNFHQDLVDVVRVGVAGKFVFDDIECMLQSLMIVEVSIDCHSVCIPRSEGELQVSHRIGSLETGVFGESSPAILEVMHASIVRLFVKSLGQASHHFPQFRSDLGINPCGFDFEDIDDLAEGIIGGAVLHLREQVQQTGLFLITQTAVRDR